MLEENDSSASCKVVKKISPIYLQEPPTCSADSNIPSISVGGGTQHWSKNVGPPLENIGKTSSSGLSLEYGGDMG
eukprot:g60059.t1